MRSVCVMLLLCLALTGCGVTGEVENQAYALVMGVDRTEAGIGLTIRIPRIGQGGQGDDKSGGKGEPYLVLSAEGSDYVQAMENLQWAAARELNLSHLKLLVVSETLASEEGFPTLLRRLAETRHLYTTAGFIVCEGKARDFIEGQETLLGSHLSGDIEATFRHYAAHGFIPKATFADLYFGTLSRYSDPVGIWGFPDPGEKPAAAVIETDESRLNEQTRTASSRQYLGTAVFREGRLAMKLNAAETLGLNLLTGRVNSFTYKANGRAWDLSTLRRPRVKVDTKGDKPVVRVDVYLTSAQQEGLNVLEGAVSQDLMVLIGRCQAMGVEPFGFAEKAAKHFITIIDWLEYDWHTRFQQAEIEVVTHISGPDK